PFCGGGRRSTVRPGTLEYLVADRTCARPNAATDTGRAGVGSARSFLRIRARFNCPPVFPPSSKKPDAKAGVAMMKRAPILAPAKRGRATIWGVKLHLPTRHALC